MEFTKLRFLVSCTLLFYIFTPAIAIPTPEEQRLYRPHQLHALNRPRFQKRQASLDLLLAKLSGFPLVALSL